MSGQIVNISTKDLISEAALKCGDALMRDLPKNLYSQAVYRAQRFIASQYGLLERVWTYTNVDGDSELDIIPQNFNGEWRVEITKPASDSSSSPTTTPYSKVQYQEVDNELTDLNYNVMLPDYRYSITYIANRYVLKYSGAGANDVVTIYYISGIAGEEDFEPYDVNGDPNLIPVIPNRYYEETLRKSILWACDLGIARYGDTFKGKRFATVRKLHMRNDDLLKPKGLEESRPWITVKLFTKQFPGD